MKILMATMGLDIGGAETHIVELAKELRHQGSVVKATLVEDESVIGKLKDADEQLAVCTFVEITELLPVG